MCNGLELSGIHTCNGLSEIIAPECSMRDGPPEVPALADIASYGIKILSIDHSDFAKWPETGDQANQRLEWKGEILTTVLNLNQLYKWQE